MSNISVKKNLHSFPRHKENDGLKKTTPIKNRPEGRFSLRLLKLYLNNALTWPSDVGETAGGV